MDSDEGRRAVTLRGRFYRAKSRLMHRFNLHHTRRIGPLEPHGGMVEKCDWCGLSRSIPPWEVEGRPPTRADLDRLREFKETSR